MEVKTKMLEEKYLELKRRVDIYYDVQDVRIRTENRLRISVPGEARTEYPGRLQAIEESLKLEIMQILQEEPIWKEFLSKWRGIGPCLAGGLIARLMVRYAQRAPTNELEEKWILKTKDKKTLVPERRGIEAFANPSKLFAFCGLDVRNGKAPRRVRGQRESVTWSPEMRVLSWKIAEQFIKQGRYYRQVYLSARQIYDAREDLQKGKGAKGHRYNMAKRKMVKQFLTDLWVAWRKLEGLPTVNPYIVDKYPEQQHRYISPPPLGDRESVEEFKPDTT